MKTASRRSCRASLGLPGSRGTTILFHSLSQSQHVRFLCLRPTLILCVLRVSRTLAERGRLAPPSPPPQGRIVMFNGTATLQRDQCIMNYEKKKQCRKGRSGKKRNQR